jgi:hypothetical protein
MPRTIDMQDLPPHHPALSTAPNRTTQRPISLPHKGYRRIPSDIRRASLAVAIGLSWGTIRARLVAIIIALVLALALSSVPMAYADIPSGTKPCRNKIFAENNRKYCAKSERPNYVGPARAARPGIPSPAQFRPGGPKYKPAPNAPVGAGQPAAEADEDDRGDGAVHNLQAEAATAARVDHQRR